MITGEDEDLPAAFGQFGNGSVDGPTKLLGLKLAGRICFILGMLAMFEEKSFVVALRFQIIETPVSHGAVQISAYAGSGPPLLPEAPHVAKNNLYHIFGHILRTYVRARKIDELLVIGAEKLLECCQITHPDPFDQRLVQLRAYRDIH